ncbi:MAG: Haloalkane dehalogenase [Pseudomonas sp.]|nr:MAG: Haloalkane dehalogenase [Pseudomonas sp.]
MNQHSTNTYVLVAGAWHGAWVWRDIIPALRALGHTVSAPTLTGLGERRHNATHDTGLGTHIEDVVAHIEMENLDAVTLVGWSYGGMVIAGVASRLPGKVKSMIYLDAFVPENGKALVDYIPTENRARLEVFVSEGKPIPAFPLEVFGITDPVLVDYITPRLAPQPWLTFFEPVQLQPLREGIAVSYVYCQGYVGSAFGHFYEQFKNDPNVRTAVLDTSHHCMLLDPLATLETLVNLG